MTMRRRDFLSLLGGAAAVWPIAARAQQMAMPVIGLLSSTSPDTTPATNMAALRQGLNDIGYAEHRNVAFEYRWAEGQYDRLPAMAADLVRRGVDVIYTIAVPATRAAAMATTTIPIVFSIGGDPVREGLVPRLNRPEGNLTGVTVFFGELAAKRLELLHELVPKATVIGVLVNPSNPNVEYRLQDIQEAASAIRQQIQIFKAGSERDIDTIFADLVRQGVSALFVIDDPLFEIRSQQLVALAARHAIPASYPFRSDAAAGGLMSYGASYTDSSRQIGVLIGRILKGAKPVDLPIVQPTGFELVINLQTAKALGLTVPPLLLARADEVIE